MQYLTPAETALGLLALAGAGVAILFIAVVLIGLLDKLLSKSTDIDDPWKL